MKRESSSRIRCSFCGKETKDVRKLIAGPQVHICDECVTLCNEIIAEDFQREEQKKLVARNMKPKTVKEFLDDHIIGQSLAKKALSVAVYNHYKRIDDESDDGIELQKGNILLLGPTGVGKTLMAQTLAKLLDVPFTMADATSMTEAGYVGEDVENIIKNLWIAAGKDVNKASRGIVCVDEIDKIARQGNSPSMTRDVGGEGVQQALLKMIESEKVMIPPEGNRNRPQQEFIQVDTTNVLFICCGSFSGLEKLVQQRTGKTSIGFGADFSQKKQHLNELLRQVEPEDLIKFGLIPEFVGRVPIIVPFDELEKEDLLKILWKPKNSLIKQYKTLIGLGNVKLSFSDSAMEAVVNTAIERKSGARGLRTIMEESMLEIMYELPSMTNVPECVITEDVVLNGSKPLLLRNKKSA